VLGLTQKDAEEELSELSLKQERFEETGDAAVVVEQDPLLTFEAYEKNVVRTLGVNSEKILKIKIYGEAPKTAKYLRGGTGLIYARIARLKVFLVAPPFHFILFSAEPYPFQVFERKLTDTLTPENTPKKLVDAFELGVTNSIKKHLGLIGVRLKQSNSFGPTGEDFEGTNLVGKVTGSFKALENLKEGDRVYVMQA